MWSYLGLPSQFKIFSISKRSVNFLLQPIHHLIFLPFSQNIFFFFLLTISTACRRPSLSTFHPYLYSPSHFNLLQFFAYLIQTRSLHHHKTSIMTHLSPTFMSFFFTFKINSMCYYAKYVLL